MNEQEKINIPVEYVEHVEKVDVTDSRWWRYDDEWVKCETCQKNNAIGVAAVPGIPYSAAYCDTCLHANAHPWWVLIANQCAIDLPLGLTAQWWQQMVHDTCEHLGRTLEEFKAEVLEASIDEDEAMYWRNEDDERQSPPQPF